MSMEDQMESPPRDETSGGPEECQSRAAIDDPENRPKGSNSQAASIPVEFTAVIRAGAPVSKVIELQADGTVKATTRGDFAIGWMQPIHLADWWEFAHYIENCPMNVAVNRACLRPDLLEPAHAAGKDFVYLTWKGSPRAGEPGFAARVKENFFFPPDKPAFALLDFDDRGMPAIVRDKLVKIGGFVEALKLIVPGFADAAYIARRSTTAGIHNPITGKTKEGGMHCFPLLADGSKQHEFLQQVHQRAWGDGLGWHIIAKDGALLERSIVDTSVWGANALVFEADPELRSAAGVNACLTQEPRPVIGHDGSPLALPPVLKKEKLASVKEAMRRDRERWKPESERVAAAYFIERKAQGVAAGLTEDEADRMVINAKRLILTPGHFVEFGEPSLGRVDVAKILANPERYDKKACYDPVEGREYGHTTGNFYADAMVINSFAHGKRVFKIRSAEEAEQPEFNIDQFISLGNRTHEYVLIPNGKLWSVGSVDGQLPWIPRFDKDGNPIFYISGERAGEQKMTAPHVWLDIHAAVQDMIWHPGHAQFINDQLVDGQSLIPVPGARIYNRYRPPPKCQGDASKAGFWLRLVKRLYPKDWPHIVAFFAHTLQRPGVKINHTLLLGGGGGIGKDAMIEPLPRALGGPPNFGEASPKMILSDDFNGYIECLCLRISEMRDLGGEGSRFQLYETMKTLAATPPHFISCNEKFIPRHPVFNCCSTIATTNHYFGAVYLPPDDRRNYAAWSKVLRGEFKDRYWPAYFKKLDAGGDADVAAFLLVYDLAGFDAKKAPTQTEWWHAIVGAAQSGDNELLENLIESLGNPKVLTLAQLQTKAAGSPFGKWLEEPKSRPSIPPKLLECGYVFVPNRVNGREVNRGRWKIAGEKQSVYGRTDLSSQERFDAAEAMAREIPTEARQELAIAQNDVKFAKQRLEAAEKRAKEDKNIVVPIMKNIFTDLSHLETKTK